MIDILFSHHLYATLFYQIKPFTNSHTAHLQKSEPMIYKKSINEKRISQQCNSLNYAVNFLHCWRYYRPLACHFFIVHLVVLENLRLIILKRSFFNLELRLIHSTLFIWFPVFPYRSSCDMIFPFNSCSKKWA